MAGNDDIVSRRILKVRVHATTYDDAAQRTLAWVLAGESRYVCACNVHMIMEAYDDVRFCDVVNGADLVTPDGMPLVWALRALGVQGAARVYGPDLMLALCAAASREHIPIGLYGATPQVLNQLVERIHAAFPGLTLSFARSPSFGSDNTHHADIEDIRKAGVRLLFVALGCPKQERWMASNYRKLPAVMVGVGAAFDFIAGCKPQAPAVLQSVGLEWAFRLASEPRRLWRRYTVHNPRFAVLFARQLMQRTLRNNNPSDR
jgi:N-acetylglucosaminyldiphosphoundecaprenol N-acetyl-beta-D-mannosaminyltransferase